MRKLTDKMNAFCELYVLHEFNGTKAYQEAYEQKDKNIAAVEANSMLKDPRIQKRINEVEGDYRNAGHKIGINKRFIMDKIKMLLCAKTPLYFQGEKVGEKDDTVAVNNAIQTYAKLVGDFAAEKISLVEEEDDIEFDINKLTTEEIEEIKQRLLSSM